MPISLIAAVALGSVLGGFVQGLSGFAFGLVALGIWAWTLDPALAGSLVVFGSLLGQLLSFGTVRQAMDVARVAPFIVGGLLGIPIGVVLLRVIEPVGFKLAVGIILLLWCPTMLLGRWLPQVSGGGKWADAGVGWIGGIMGGLGGLTGPAPTLWCALRGWSRDTQRAVFQSFNLVMQAVTMVAYLATGTIDAAAVWMFAIVAPAMLVPTLIGARLYRRLDEDGFRRLVLWLLTASGGMLVISSLLRL